MIAKDLCAKAMWVYRTVAKACAPKLCERIETIAKTLRAKALHCRANRLGGRC